MQVEKFSFAFLSSFVVLVIGTLIYNEIWVLPCGWMKNNTEK
jgi:hypothetical protein